MEIDEKDIIFGVIRCGEKTAIVSHGETGRDAATLFGALSYIAALDESFLGGLKGVIENAERNGAEIRETARRLLASGRIAALRQDKPKS